MTTAREAFEAKYQRSADDPASAEMLAVFTEGWEASRMPTQAVREAFEALMPEPAVLLWQDHPAGAIPIRGYAAGQMLAIAEAADRQSPWRRAIDSALLNAGLDCLGPDDQAEDAMQRLLNWTVTCALDPSISPGAAALAQAADKAATERERERDARKIDSCSCEVCSPQGDGFAVPMRMILCAKCGNKRCPHATDHRNACTDSNEVGQKGSSWENVKPISERLKEAAAIRSGGREG